MASLDEKIGIKYPKSTNQISSGAEVKGPSPYFFGENLHFFIVVSQPDTKPPFLCIVNNRLNHLKLCKNGNCLSDLLQTLRHTFQPLGRCRLWLPSDVCRLWGDGWLHRNRDLDSLPVVPPPTQHHTRGVSRAGRNDLHLGLGRCCCFSSLLPSVRMSCFT